MKLKVADPLKRKWERGIYMGADSTNPEAVRRFEGRRADFAPAAARRQALGFNRRRFSEEMTAYLRAVLGGRAASVRRAA